jgi:hypothetical protein
MPFSDCPFTEPPDNVNAALLRYVNLEELVFLLSTRQLHFTRSDQFTDRFEGAQAEANIKDRQRMVAEGELDLVEAQQLEDIAREMRFGTFISCWSTGPESVAMWRLYSHEKNGLAIESSYERLKSAVEGDHRVCISRVTYAEHQTAAIPPENTLAPFLYKKISFDYEREVRAIVQECDAAVFTGFRPDPPLLSHLRSENQDGIYVPVDMRSVIACVRLSPVAQPWYGDVVKSVVGQYGYDFPVEQSDLAGEPSY